MYLIGLDLGSTNIKALLVEASSGSITAKLSLPTPTRYLPDGGAEYDAAQVAETVLELLAGLADQAPHKEDIAAISFASMAESGVALDQAGEPLAPSMAWFDRRSLAPAQSFLAGRDPFELYQLTGMQPSHIPSLCKILWEKQNLPGVHESTHKWLFLPNYVALMLCGELCTDPTQACRSMAYEFKTGVWSQDICAQAGIDPAIFPEVRPAGQAIAGLRPQIASRLGLNPRVQVVMGGHDHTCGSLSVGLMEKGHATNSSGTVDNALTIISPDEIGRALFDLGMTCGPYILGDVRYSMGGIQGAGRAVDWFVENWLQNQDGQDGGPDPYTRLLQAAQEAPAGSDGVIFIPHLRGSTAPHKSSIARGAFVGLKDTHTWGHMARALFEGLSMEYRLMVDGLEAALGRRLGSLTCFGGGSQNAFWARIKAAVLNRPLTICHTQENTALGAVALAGLGSGVYRDMEQAVECLSGGSHQVEPDADLAAYYEERFQKVYRQVYASLKGIDAALEAEST